MKADRRFVVPRVEETCGGGFHLYICIPGERDGGSFSYRRTADGQWKLKAVNMTRLRAFCL